MPRDLLNKANRLMNTANNTAWNVQRTKQTVDRFGSDRRNAKQQQVAQQSLEWNCVCGKKVASKFCDNCGKAKPACPSCGAAATGSRFCGECGSAME